MLLYVVTWMHTSCHFLTGKGAMVGKRELLSLLMLQPVLSMLLLSPPTPSSLSLSLLPLLKQLQTVQNILRNRQRWF